MEVANALRTKTMSFLEYFYRGGYTSRRAFENRSVYDALKDSEINRFIKAPDKLKHRFIEEDVEFGLVPFSSLGGMYGVDTPTINSLIHLSSLLNKKNYWSTGATVDKLGIAGLTLEELHDYVKHGTG
jgi:opine dehydrogenase